MQYRLMAIDLDGTSIEEGQLPNERVRKAVAAATGRGVRVIVATGRPYTSALQYGAALELRTPLICYQGALVKEVEGRRETLLAEEMPEAELEEAVAFADEHQLDLNLYTEEAFYLARLAHPQAFYDQWFNLPLRTVGSLVDALPRLRSQGHKFLKALFLGEPADGDRLLPVLRDRFAGRLTVVRSHSLMVEICSLSASKGQALAFLAGRFGIPRAETIAVGDSGNDESMVRWAGLGVAVANAMPEVLAAADWVAPPVTEDGVVEVIERFILRNGHAGS